MRLVQNPSPSKQRKTRLHREGAEEEGKRMNYRITNIEYGIGPWGSEFIYGMVGNPCPGATEQNVHSVTLIQGGGKNILVDTGVDTEKPAKKEMWDGLITRCNGVIWALGQVNLTPDDIDVVILTHAHIDHIGGVERFGNARIFIQQDEFEAWEKMVADPRYSQLTLPAAMPADYPPMRRMIETGALTLLNGDVVNFLPGVDIHVARNCHSVAEQVVVVKNTPDEAASPAIVHNEQGDRMVVDSRSPHFAPLAPKTYIIGGDIALRPANLTGMGNWRGFLAPMLGRSGSAYDVMREYDWILDVIDGDMTRLVLTHDSTMTERFRSEQIDEGLHIHYVC